jgi:hypothetical protein
MTDEVHEDDRPWERPGAVRRDAEPHRGQLLQLLGVAGLMCGFFSPLGGLVAVLNYPLAIVASSLIVGLGLSTVVVVLVLSARDLRQVRARLMDRAGGRLVAEARRHARVALVFGVIGGSAGWCVGLLLA